MDGASLRAAREALVVGVLEGRLPPSGLPPRYSRAADEYLTRLFAAAVTDPTERSGLALVAVGGYGRAELAPGSDLDVLLLHDRRRDVKAVADRIWYCVWDGGARLDHSVRTAKEAVAVARRDLRALLGLLDARAVCGDVALVTALSAQVRDLWRARRRRLVPELLGAMRERHERFGELPFLLEPNLKESAGGLRDLEVIRLVSRAFPSIAASVHTDALDRARELLLASRVALHGRTANPADRLVLQEQDGVATLLGFPDADAFAAALAAAGREVMWASGDAARRAESCLAGPAARARSRDRELDRGVLLRDGEVTLPAAAELAEDPDVVLRVAAAAARHEVPIAVAALTRMAAERPQLASPWPAPMGETFVSLLEYGAPATPVLEALDRAGLLEWLLPEWELVRHRPQSNAYHRFTVDRHLLEAAAQAALLLRRVERPDLLLLGALLHDIGKGQPGDHSETGRRVAAAVARRVGLGARDVAVVERLVKRHLLLADTATRRDVEDPETIEVVAEAVGDRLTLDLLEQLTTADSLATGPAAWSPWKASLVAALAANVRALFDGCVEQRSPAEPLDEGVLALVRAGDLAVRVGGPGVFGARAVTETVTVVAPDRPGLFALAAGTLAVHGLAIRSATALAVAPMAVEVFEVEQDPGRPVDVGRLEEDLRQALEGRFEIEGRLRALDEAYSRYRRPAAAKSPAVVVILDEGASASAAVVEVRAPDSHGLLHRLAWCLAAAGLDVVSARIATLGHEVVDSFYLREQHDGSPPRRERLEALRPGLEAAARLVGNPTP